MEAQLDDESFSSKAMRQRKETISFYIKKIVFMFLCCNNNAYGRL